MDDKPLLSVIIVTYNHVNYIEQAIESALMQKTDFDFEIIIGEDCSNDGTREIVKSFAEKNRKINALLHANNLGFGGRINAKISLQAASGKYMAILEGDDFWTDPYKLQKQVDFLEHNPEFAICFHNAKIIYEDEPGKAAFSNLPGQPEVTNFEDLATGEFIYTATAVFRNEDFRKFPEKYFSYLNNYTLDLNNAQYGSIRYINEVMGVYRTHRGGTWSMVSREKTLNAQLPVYKFYVQYFHKKYRKYFLSHLKNMTAELIGIKLQKNDFTDFWKYYKDYVFYNITNRNEFRNMTLFFLKGSKGKIKSFFSTND